jgi:hypothetical protein
MAQMPPILVQVKVELDEALLAKLRAAVRGSCACTHCKSFLTGLLDTASGDGQS